MKKLTLILMAAFFAATGVFGQGPKMTKGHNTENKKGTKIERPALPKLEGNVVSSISKNAFMRDFPKASDVHWSRSVNFDEAAFTMEGKDYTAYYDYDGHLVGTTTPKTLEDLPARAQKEISKKYSDYHLFKVLEFHDNDANVTDMLLYGTQFDDADNYFAELSNGTGSIVLKIDINGFVEFFTELK